jgi:hypothetical protein
MCKMGDRGDRRGDACPASAGPWFPAGSVVHAVPVSAHGAVSAADGILLEGQTLYAVRNAGNVAVIELAPDLSSGTIVDQLTGNLDVPTTVARFGSSLYVVNARFGTTDEPPVPYWVTRLDR